MIYTDFLKRIVLNIISAINRNIFDLELISVLNMFLHEYIASKNS